MIWGQTTHEWHEWITNWHLRFAWWPVKLMDGRRAWLVPVYRRLTWLPGYGVLLGARTDYVLASDPVLHSPQSNRPPEDAPTKT